MSTPGLRTLSPALQRFFAATVISTIGSVSLFAFGLIYFHEVRGIPLGQAGIAVASTSFAMVALSPLGGSLSDRFGPKRMLGVGCVASMVSVALWMPVTSFAGALAVSMLLGASNALWFPAQAAMLALAVPTELRPAVSAFQRAALNLGAAFGGLVGGLIVRSETLGAFRVLFVVDIVTYVAFLAAMPGLPSGRVPPSERHQERPGFAQALADRFFLRLLVTDIAIALGFGFLWAFMPAYASEIGIGNGTIGVLFGLGAACVVVTQIPTLRWVRGGSRMNWLVVMNLWFAAAFTIMALTPHVAVSIAIVAIAVAQMLGGFGEAVLGAVRTPLTSDLAPAELQGRYHGLATMVFQACMGVASAVGGVVMQHSLSLVWVIPLVVSLAGAAGTAAIRRQIPAELALSA